VLILDVDGVLTDGGIVYSDSGCELKQFQVQDGDAIKRWRLAGHQTALLSGRTSAVVKRRAAELGIEHVEQGCTDKGAGVAALLDRLQVRDEAVCYMGDDTLDLPPMRRCGFPAAVANAGPVVKQAAQYVTRRAGGRGAVAEVVELLLRKQGRWRPSESE
jgi:3-deoxy-D-manno-octulosonate 8-phosphate phosphatase (KDO 8-P phosphatase)